MKTHLNEATAYPQRAFEEGIRNLCGMTMLGNLKRQQFEPQITENIEEITCKKCLAELERCEEWQKERLGE